MIEQNILKNKNKELSAIKGAQIPLGEQINCKNGNEVKMDLAEERQASGISFLQIGKTKPAGQGFFELFFATLKNPIVNALRSINFQASIWVNEERRLRRLQNNKSPQDTNVNCVLENSFGDASGYGRSNTKKVKGTIEENARMKVNEDSISNIAGIRDKLDTDKVNNKIDYSDPNNLKTIGELYHVKITDINGNNCPNKGQLIIFGETTSNENLNENYKDVDITFGYPESGGLCSISIQDKLVKMICETKEKFDMSQIIIDRAVIEASEGNPLFILQEFTTLESIKCDISLNSIKSEPMSRPDRTDSTKSSSSPDSSSNITNPSTQDESIGTFRQIMKKSDSGLSGGAIAAIVICLLAALIAIGIIFVLKRKGTFGKDKSVKEFETSISNLKVDK